mmetsp:Transcript_102033/g.304455  ORF Transcript_102033/g.304455 Transcript_102033/m.304455 type:complete len:247 (-) Transcript_102033:62-802(-)
MTTSSRGLCSCLVKQCQRKGWKQLRLLVVGQMTDTRTPGFCSSAQYERRPPGQKRPSVSPQRAISTWLHRNAANGMEPRSVRNLWNFACTSSWSLSGQPQRAQGRCSPQLPVSLLRLRSKYDGQVKRLPSKVGKAPQRDGRHWPRASRHASPSPASACSLGRSTSSSTLDSGGEAVLLDDGAHPLQPWQRRQRPRGRPEAPRWTTPGKGVLSDLGSSGSSSAGESAWIWAVPSSSSSWSKSKPNVI